MPASGSPGRSDGILDERGGRVEGAGDREDGRQLLVVDPDEASRLLGGVQGLRGDRRDRLAVIVGLADREDRPILELRAEARHRLWEVRRGEREAHAGHLECGARVDGDDPRPGAVEAHELRVEHVLEMEVGHVRLPAGDPVEPADPGG